MYISNGDAIENIKKKKRKNPTRERENERAQNMGHARWSLREKKEDKKRKPNLVNINVFNDLVHMKQHVNTWIDYHNASINI